MESWKSAILEGERRDPTEARGVDAYGIYAWWGGEGVPRPAGFPRVDPGLPLYIGIAERETLSQRIIDCHLSRTRGSALRRSLAALLLDELDLRPHIIPGSRSRPSKYGMASAGELELTAWMLERLSLSWVEHPDPGPLEREIVGELIPPLNDSLAKGSSYRTHMRVLRHNTARCRPAQG